MKDNDYIIRLNDGTQVFVNKEVYQAYYRMKWREEWNTRSFYRHNISMHSNLSKIPGECFTLEDRLPANTLTPEEQYLSQEFIESLNILSPDEKQIITLIYLDNLSETDCAAIMKKSRKFIRYHKDKALGKLKEMLETIGESFGSPT